MADSLLDKAFRVITSFEADDDYLSLAEIGRRAGTAKATTWRIVSTLERWGALERDGRRVVLGMRLFELGQLVPARRSLRETGLPFLEDLYEVTHENVHLAVLDGTEVLYVEKISGRQATSAATRVGGRLPASCTGVGRAILAFSPPETVAAVVEAGLARMTPRSIATPGMFMKSLATARRRGIAVSDGEVRTSVLSVGAPVFSHDGTVVAGLSVSGRSTRLDPLRVGPAVRTAALALSRQLGASH